MREREEKKSSQVQLPPMSSLEKFITEMWIHMTEAQIEGEKKIEGSEEHFFLSLCLFTVSFDIHIAMGIDFNTLGENFGVR